MLAVLLVFVRALLALLRVLLFLCLHTHIHFFFGLRLTLLELRSLLFLLFFRDSLLLLLRPLSASHSEYLHLIEGTCISSEVPAFRDDYLGLCEGSGTPFS